MVAALALPFAPVWTDTTTLTWPQPGLGPRTTAAIVVPYRPADLRADIPCSALRAGASDGPATVVLATDTGTGGLQVTADSVQFDGHRVQLSLPPDVPPAADCRAVVTGDAAGVSVVAPDGTRTDLPGQPVPEVFGFRTDLSQADGSGLAITVHVTEPFTTSPGALKYGLIVLQLLAVGAALLLLPRRPGRPRPPGRRATLRWRSVWWVDVAVVAVFVAWAVIGPLAVDDGWAAIIARNFAATGNPGNYYRWWNAAEVPFALDQQLLAPLTQISLAPLWLRMPSTVLAIATWFALSRGVLGAALPGRARTAGVRWLAAGCLLITWLPFNLGARPESYVALGVTVTLALALRARSAGGLGLMVLTAALTAPISPNSVLVAAPFIVLAPRLLRVLRASAPTRAHLLAHAALLCCIGAVGLTVMFGDQSLDALLTATDWHTFFGPSLPWYEEPDRYRYLLGTDQQGSFAKRLPVLLSVAMLLPVGLFAVRRRDRDTVGRTAVRLAAVAVVGVLLFALSPSKWSYHLGAASGLLAGLLTVGVVIVARRARAPDRYLVIGGVCGSALLIAATALAFAGPSAWWQPTAYDVPWADGPPRPLGVALDGPLPWLVAVAALWTVVAVRHRAARASAGSPALVVVIAVTVVLAILIGSFVAAPLRRPEGSLAMMNLHRLTGSKVCGLADDVQLLPDGPSLSAVGGGHRLTGFTAQSGFLPGAPPPDPPGTGTSTYLWGSRTPDESATGEMTSDWFVLPPQPADGGVAVSVSGRTDGGNGLTFEFGRSDGPDVVPLGDRTPIDRPASDEKADHPLWRTIGVDATDLPAGSDRIRIHAVDGRSDAFGWLAVTGPRLRTIVALNDFLARNAPVLVSWPQAFLFPCVHDVPTISAGVANTPRTVIESPRPHLADDRKRDVGGVFAALAAFGDLHEIPSRLVGHPEVDWGSIEVTGGTAVPDAYQRTVTRHLVAGSGGTRHTPPEE